MGYDIEAYWRLGIMDLHRNGMMSDDLSTMIRPIDIDVTFLSLLCVRIMVFDRLDT